MNPKIEDIIIPDKTASQKTKYLGRESMLCFYCRYSFVPTEASRYKQAWYIDASLAAVAGLALMLPIWGWGWLLLSIPVAVVALLLIADIRKSIPVACPQCGKYVLYRPNRPRGRG